MASPGKVAVKNLVLSIKVGPSKKVAFAIRKGEKLNRVVSKFAAEHKLDKDSEMLLRKLLENKIANKLKE